MPVAFYFTAGLTGEQLASAIKAVIYQAYEVGISVKVVVADGHKCNINAAKILGVDLSLSSMKPYFQIKETMNTIDRSTRIYWIMDACHMLKLTRNCLAQYKVLCSINEANEKEIIAWEFIEKLHKLQCSDTLVLANKLSAKHIYYYRAVQKVRVAAQTLSNSVAEAIDFLRVEMNLPEFAGSEPTTRFIRTIDKLFDMLNSRNPFSRGYKSPLRLSNRVYWKTSFDNITRYLLSLRAADGVTSILKTPRFTPFLGFIVDIQSISLLADELLEDRQFKYFLTYRTSQDHLELLFVKIRQRGGWNNNPTTVQFCSALKTILMSKFVRPSKNGNVDVEYDQTQEECSLDFRSSKRSCQIVNDIDVGEDEDVRAAESLLSSQLMRIYSSSVCDWKDNVLYYCAGFVAQRIEKRVACMMCTSTLFHQVGDPSPEQFGFSKFLIHRQRGGLRVPSLGVYLIIQAAEKAFRSLVPFSPDALQLPQMKNIDKKIEHVVLNTVPRSTAFPLLYLEHFCDHEFAIESDHVIKLMRCITACFIKIRLFKFGKIYFERRIFNAKESSRQQSTKLVLFRGQ